MAQWHLLIGLWRGAVRGLSDIATDGAVADDSGHGHVGQWVWASFLFLSFCGVERKE